MAKLNHARRNQADLIPADYEPIFMARWLTMPFGAHKGKTLPTILFTDPAYLGWLKQGNVINCASYYGKELKRQLGVVCNRAEHILAPERYGKKTRFVTIVDRHDVFERVVLTPKTAHPPIELAAGSKIVKRSTELAVPIVLDYDNPNLGFKRMARSLRQMFASRSSEWTADQQYERFVEDDDYFDLTNIRRDAFL